jgi:hypothetical protein
MRWSIDWIDECFLLWTTTIGGWGEERRNYSRANDLNVFDEWFRWFDCFSIISSAAAGALKSCPDILFFKKKLCGVEFCLVIFLSFSIAEHSLQRAAQVSLSYVGTQKVSSPAAVNLWPRSRRRVYYLKDIERQWTHGFTLTLTFSVPTISHPLRPRRVPQCPNMCHLLHIGKENAPDGR